MPQANGNGPHLDGPGAAYVRVSGDDQETERQHEAARAFERRHGVSIPPEHYFEDHGWARDQAARRPAFQRLLGKADAGLVRWIVVDQIDRFGFADQWELAEMILRLRKAGCRLYDTRGDEWTARDLLGFIKAGIAGSQSHEEQVQKSYRALGGKVKKAREGEWMGGPPRLGFDVGCFDRASGEELYRVVFEGREQVGTTLRKGKQRPVYFVRRLKVYPDGRSERLDGKVVFRLSKEAQALHVVPTRDKAKLAAAQGLFQRYAAERVTFFELAKWLNSLGVRNSFGRMFQAVDVVKMLSDEVYLGTPTFSKRRNGRFHRHSAAGGVTALEAELRGKDTACLPADVIKSGRRLYEPLVDQATWDAVQKKLGGRDKAAHAPKNPAMYLSGLVACAGCGLPMIARAESREYCCGTWDRHRTRGALAECPCQRNGLKQADLEHYINHYLPECRKRLRLLQEGAGDGSLVHRLEGQQQASWQAFLESCDRLTGYLCAHCPDDYNALLRGEEEARAEAEAVLRAQDAGAGRPPDLAAWLARQTPARQEALAKSLAEANERPVDYLPDHAADRLRLYRQHFDPVALEAEVARLDAEHTRMMERWADAPGKLAKDKAKARIEELDARIADLRRQQEDLAVVVCQHYRQVHDLDVAVTDAQRAMRSEASAQALRRRAEALRGLLVRIECEFTPTGARGRGGPGNAKSRLVAITFEPVAGEVRKVALDAGAAGANVGGRFYVS
jgi:DNA invertase Pin-like site-specific DNA recombinase